MSPLVKGVEPEFESLDEEASVDDTVFFLLSPPVSRLKRVRFAAFPRGIFTELSCWFALRQKMCICASIK